MYLAPAAARACLYLPMYLRVYLACTCARAASGPPGVTRPDASPPAVAGQVH